VGKGQNKREENGWSSYIVSFGPAYFYASQGSIDDRIRIERKVDQVGRDEWDLRDVATGYYGDGD
jgi:hypothetical protein